MLRSLVGSEMCIRDSFKALGKIHLATVQYRYWYVSCNNYIMRKIAISIQKGGSGKTTTVYNLAAELAAAGQHVITLDLDAQATLTSYANVPAAGTMADVFNGSHTPVSYTHLTLPTIYSV